MTDKSSVLRDLLVDTLIAAVRDGVPVKDDTTGEVRTAPAPVGVLNVARQYIKDNPPQELPAPGRATGVLKSHMDKLPFAAPLPDNAGA